MEIILIVTIVSSDTPKQRPKRKTHEGPFPRYGSRTATRSRFANSRYRPFICKPTNPQKSKSACKPIKNTSKIEIPHTKFPY